jgi:hypothetical protein
LAALWPWGKLSLCKQQVALNIVEMNLKFMYFTRTFIVSNLRQQVCKINISTNLKYPTIMAALEPSAYKRHNFHSFGFAGVTLLMKG